MKVEVLSSINSGQFDRGDIEDFPDEQAEYFIKKGIARSLSDKEKAERTESDTLKETLEKKDSEITELKEQLMELKKMVVTSESKKGTAKIKKPAPSTYRKTKTK